MRGPPRAILSVCLLLTGASAHVRRHSAYKNETRSLQETERGASVFTLGEPTFLGSGCPEGTVEVVPSPDGQTVSVLFSEYEASTTSTKTRERKSCNLAVPVNVKSGISIGVYRVDYRGYAFVPNNQGSSAKFNVEYFFAGGRGPSLRKTYRPGFDDDVFVSDDMGVAVWTRCGQKTNFRINSSITAKKKNSNDEDVNIQLDTVDTTIDERGAFRYYIQHREC